MLLQKIFSIATQSIIVTVKPSKRFHKVAFNAIYLISLGC